jgi:hypothetical protein
LQDRFFSCQPKFVLSLKQKNNLSIPGLLLNNPI